MLIRDGRVLVNGVIARPSLRLAPGDAVRVEVPEPAPAALEAEDLPLAIVFEDEHLIVVDKPAGIVVHPGAGVRRGTLVHALLHHAPEIAGVGGEGRPGLVHRLDRDTTGLMVVARTPRAYRALVEAIQARRVSRVYHALVWDDPALDAGTIDAPVGRDPRERKRMAVVRTGRPARTHWRVLERFGLAAHLELRLDTGRTHQIRVHLAHLGHPVVGDPTYGGRGKKQLRGGDAGRSLAAALLECLPRQALHAIELGLDHPVTGDRLLFTRPVPDDFARALDLLRSRHPSAPASKP
jgi:23S rRNA pseudouridine1911/1915/1917 synthase